MANGENSRWSQGKITMAAWWDRSGWKTVAHVAVPLAIIFAAVAALQRSELQTRRLHIPTDPTGPNWAEIAMVVLTVIIAIGGFLAGYFALGAVREARRARNAVQMTELSRRWDEQENQDVRRMVRRYAEIGLDAFDHVAPPGPHRLKEVVMKLQQDNAPDYRMLVTDPNFLEDVAILIQEGGIDLDIVNRSLGYNIPYRWSLWEPTVDALRELTGGKQTYKEFEGLAKQIAPKYPESIKIDRNGVIVWEKFID